METSDHVWIIITGIAAIVGAFVGFFPALDAVRSWLSSQAALRASILDALPAIDADTLEAYTPVPATKEEQEQRRNFFRSASGPLSQLKQRTGAYPNTLLSTLRGLIDENTIGMWTDFDYEITPDFVLLTGNNKITHAARPYFFKGTLPGDLREPEGRVGVVIRSARPKRNPVLNIALGTTTP